MLNDQLIRIKKCLSVCLSGALCKFCVWGASVDKCKMCVYGFCLVFVFMFKRVLSALKLEVRCFELKVKLSGVEWSCVWSWMDLELVGVVWTWNWSCLGLAGHKIGVVCGC
jgi:hypothetical protein